MNQALLEQVQKHRKEIKHEVLSYSLSELVNMYQASPKEIKIQPEWQRLFRWSREQQTAFIESLVLEVPIPPLFFFEEKDGVWELLDGLQRVSTILKFVGAVRDVPDDHQGKAGNENEWHYDTFNNIEEPLQLLKAEYLTQLEGLTFERLPNTLKLNLKRARLQVYVLKRETDKQYKYEVFKRLNSGGSKLEEQELRNCSVRILGDEFPEFLRTLGKCESFKTTLGLKQKEISRGKSDEYALRFLTMKNYHQRFVHDVAPLLTEYMEQVAKGAVKFDPPQEQALFERTWSLLAGAAEHGDLFRHWKDDRTHGPFSPNLFELVALATAWHVDELEKLDSSTVRSKLMELAKKAKDDGLTGSGSNSKKKTLGRIDLARSWNP